MKLCQDFTDYLFSIRRYSVRTVDNYRRILDGFLSYAFDGRSPEDITDEELVSSLSCRMARGYEVHLVDVEKKSTRTVCQHMSALSSFCKCLISRGLLKSNPIAATTRPKTSKRLPQFYRKNAMDSYFRMTECYASEEYLDMCGDAFPGCLEVRKDLKKLYEKRLARAVVSTLYCTGMRRAELIGLDIDSFDISRKVLHVTGKGDKMREIPVVSSLYKEIVLYLKAVGMMVGPSHNGKDPLFVTAKGTRLYPVAVDRIIKSEFGDAAGINGRKSPHVLRHTLATELLDEGTGLFSIKELLGHSSLAATQVYTHTSADQLKKVYQTAHPRAKRR